MIRFQKYHPDKDASFILQTHWALARAAESMLEFSTSGPEVLGHLSRVKALLLKQKLKYYYRALLVKEIALVQHLGGNKKLDKAIALKKKLDDAIDAPLPD